MNYFYARPIQTTYKNLLFKSRLEAKCAQALDKLEIAWTYEPESYLLDSGSVYCPDFRLSGREQWLEAKGDDRWEQALVVIQEFVSEKHTEVLLVGYENAVYVRDEDGVEDAYVSRCKCLKWRINADICLACGPIKEQHVVRCLKDFVAVSQNN